MAELKINEAKAKALYPTASDEFKKELEKTFGESTFRPKEYEKIKSYEDACAMEGVDPQKYLPYPDAKTDDDELANLQRMLSLIYKWINKLDGDYKADFNNHNQEKWRCWFEWDSKTSGFGFGGTSYGHSSTFTFVGARLCNSSSKTAEYVGRTFLPLFRKILVIQ